MEAGVDCVGSAVLRITAEAIFTSACSRLLGAYPRINEGA
jgi:hypothetical protein